MPRKYNDKLHPRKHNGQWAKKGTGTLLPPKSGRSRSYASRQHSTVAGGTRSFAGSVNKTGGSRTKSSSRTTNALIAGAVVAAGAGLAAYGAHHYVTSLAKGGPAPVSKAKFPSFAKVGNIKVGRIRIQSPTTGRFQVQKSAFPRSK